MLGDMATAGIYVPDSRNLVLEDAKTVAQSWKSHINVNVVGPDPAVSVVAVPSNVNSAEPETLILTSIGGGRTNAPEPIKISENTPFQEINNVKPVKVDTVASLVRVLDDIAEKSVCVHQFSREYYETFDIVANLNQTTEVLYPLREVHD